ncbi:MAG: hypothetical protein QXJ74_04000 [Nitrososphaera sp.]|uniref:hypothetical protein n=1 Tax=Nitrososphaera sp. TaxID=1971748 RepID=UPI001840A61F|nr:hypothetical protein [Nitrososphaera sp.]NWG37804.1 hypothetical protein [Nitrososphaera sp.]
MEQKDLQRLLEKRWKRYRARQRRSQWKAGIALAAIRAAGTGAGLLRKIRVLRQARKESVAVE